MNVERLKPDEAYFDRIRAIKPILKLMGGYKRALITLYPQYDNLEGLDLARRVVNMRTTDVLITQRLEEAVRQWLEQQASTAPEEPTDAAA